MSQRRVKNVSYGGERTAARTQGLRDGFVFAVGSANGEVVMFLLLRLLLRLFLLLRIPSAAHNIQFRS